MTFASVIVCATPRSGSTMLCDLLAGSGVAGRPASFYRQQSIGHYAERFGVAMDEGAAFDRAYLEAVRRHGTDDTGTFGLRIMWSSVADLMARLAPLFPDCATDASRFERAFGTPLYVHLSRRNKVAQAVSRLKAEQTGLWHRAADGSERERTAPAQAAVYDGARLARFVAEAVADDAAWDPWFQRQQVTPLRLSYEELSADPGAALARILAGLGKDPAPASAVAPRTARLADAESLDWIARFEAEAASWPA